MSPTEKRDKCYHCYYMDTVGVGDFRDMVCKHDKSCPKNIDDMITCPLDSKTEDIKKKVSDLLYDTFAGVYCDSCKFENLTEGESEAEYGHYGCDFCTRKSIFWELSRDEADYLADKINKIYQK